VGKLKEPVGRREETFRLTLFRHRSAFACTSVRVCAFQFGSAVQVRAFPVWRSEDRARLTLVSIASSSSACARVSVCVRAYLKKQPRQSKTHTTTVIDMQVEGICVQSCGHTLHMETSKHMSML
jgi:hypothetical protein